MQCCPIDIHVPLREVAQQFFDECFSSLHATMLASWRREGGTLHYTRSANFEQRMYRLLHEATQNGSAPLDRTARGSSSEGGCKTATSDGSGFEWSPSPGRVRETDEDSVYAQVISHKRGCKRASYVTRSCVAKSIARIGTIQNMAAVTSRPRDASLQHGVATSGMASFPQYIMLNLADWPAQ